jgi:hypothetical protein
MTQCTDDDSAIIEFNVDKSGTITLADFVELTTREEIYESDVYGWSDSPEGLVSAMEMCPPLAWTVNTLYEEARAEIEEKIANLGEKIQDLAGRVSKKSELLRQRLGDLKARLEDMPEEPDEGVMKWVSQMEPAEFNNRVVPVIEEWMQKPPNCDWEDDYLPKTSSAQGAAMKFFEEMDANDLDALGVEIVEGEHPGSTYYAAKLRGDLKAANRAAKKNDIPVRFFRI